MFDAEGRRVSNLKKILNKIFLFLALIFLVLFILTNRGYIGYLIHPLPFEGPYSGTVMDESTGKPIAGARIIAIWSCWDFPYPHIADYFVYAHATSDEKGYYEIKRPKRRGGWFGGKFSLDVYAKEYIPAEYYIAAKNSYRPQPNPFSTITALSKFPTVLDIHLKPARPVLLKLLKSKKAIYRLWAGEKMVKLGYINSDVVTVLLALLNDESLDNKNKYIRLNAARVLAQIGQDAQIAVPTLKKILSENGTDKNLRLEIKNAIKKINPDTDR
jgi:hypothetical protein